MKLCKGDGSVFESQDLFKYMYSIKFSNRTHTIQLVIETLNKYSAAVAEKGKQTLITVVGGKCLHDYLLTQFPPHPHPLKGRKGEECLKVQGEGWEGRRL